MSDAVATSPRGWSLTDAELRVVAALVASHRINSGDEDASAASYRARVIASVRANRHKITLEMLRKIDLHCSPTREEIEAVREAVTHLSAAEEIQAERLSFIDSLSMGMGVSGGRSAFVEPPKSLRRLEVANSDIDLPLVKREWTAASTSTSAQRFFGTAELVRIVGRHLSYEKIDLIELSRVSKFFRAVALPLLVETFNVHLNGARGAHDFLAANPGLVQHVRFLRIYDHVAHLTARWSSHAGDGEYKQPPRLVPDAFDQLGSFLMLFEDENVVRQLPLLELSVGQLKLFELYSQLKRAPRVTVRLVSLQILDDFDMSSPSLVGVPFQARIVAHLDHGARLSEELSLLLNLVFDRQLEGTGSARLRSFDFAAFRSFRTGKSSMLPMLGPRLMKKLASSVQDLQLDSEVMTDIDVPTYEAFLKLHWPKLKSFRVYVSLSNLEDPDNFQRILRAFLQHHPHLSHVHIHAFDRRSPEYTEEHANANFWYSCTLPQLRSCWLESPRPPLNTLLDFLTRHPTVEDIKLHMYENPAILSAQPELMQSLRVVRSSADGTDNLLKNGAPVRELHFDINDPWDRPYDTLFFDVGSAPVPSVTFVALHLRKVSPAALLNHLDHILSLLCGGLPNLVELSVTLGDGQRSEKPDSEYESIQFLFSFLTRCSQSAQCRLRAIRIQYQGAVRLRTQQGVFVVPLDLLHTLGFLLPPTLEYLVWSAPHFRTIQHFRVIHDSGAPVPAVNNAVQHSTTTGSSTNVELSQDSITQCLQLLPASFRPKVDRTTGVWEDLDDYHSTLSLFDHTGDTIRPKFL